MLLEGDVRNFRKRTLCLDTWAFKVNIQSAVKPTRFKRDYVRTQLEPSEIELDFSQISKFSLETEIFWGALVLKWSPYIVTVHNIYVWAIFHASRLSDRVVGFDRNKRPFRTHLKCDLAIDLTTLNAPFCDYARTFLRHL